MTSVYPLIYVPNDYVKIIRKRSLEKKEKEKEENGKNYWVSPFFQDSIDNQKGLIGRLLEKGEKTSKIILGGTELLVNNKWFLILKKEDQKIEDYIGRMAFIYPRTGAELFNFRMATKGTVIDFNKTTGKHTVQIKNINYELTMYMDFEVPYEELDEEEVQPVTIKKMEFKF